MPKPSQRGEAVAIPIRLRLYFTYICQALAGHANRLSCKGAGRLPKKGTVLSSDFLLTNTLPTSYFILPSHWFCITFPLALFGSDPRKTHVSPEQHSKSGRICSGVGRYLTGLFPATKGTIDSQLSYRECTESVPKRYWKGTKELLKRYQIATKQVQAFGSFLVDRRYKLGRAMEIPSKMHSGDLEIGAYGCCLKSEGLQAFCGTRVYENEYLVVQKKTSAQKALKCVIYPGNYKRCFRISLPCLFLVIVFQSSNFSFKALKSIRALMVLALIVSMFSLSAQTPRKDSGADGLISMKALHVGDTIPQSLWDIPLAVVNNPTGKKTVKLSDYRNKKLIILDFWATWCGSCMQSMLHIRQLESSYSDKVAFLKVNSESTKDSPERIVKAFAKLKAMSNVDLSTMEYIYPDKYLDKYFAHASIPHMVWIYDGKYIGSTYAEGLTVDAIDGVLNNTPLHAHLKNDRLDFEVNMPIRNQIDLYRSTYPVVEELFTGYIKGLSPNFGQFYKKDGTYVYRMVNLKLNILYANAFRTLFFEVPSWAIHIDSTVAEPVQKALNNVELRKDVFCFEVQSSDTLTEDDILKRLRDCLLSNFKVGPVRTIEKTPFWQMEMADPDKLKASVRFIDKKGNKEYITFRELRSMIYTSLKLPVNDLITVKSSLFEVEIPKNLDWTDIKSLQDFLVTIGIRLIKVEKDIPTITFKKA